MKKALNKVTVYSPVEDKKIKTNIDTSPIWAKGKAYNEEEFMQNPKRYPFWWKYSFYFDGLKPVQVTNVKKIAN